MKIRLPIKQRKIRLQWWQLALATGGVGLLAAAVAQQLRRPKEERTWEGKVGVVPYYLRPPTVQRLRETYWNRRDSRLLRPKAFGVGWDVNLGALARKEQLLQSAWNVDPNNEADIQRVIDDTLAEDGQADFEQVLAAWHVRRGVPIDDSEAAKVHEVYQRLHGAELPQRVDRWLEAG